MAMRLTDHDRLEGKSAVWKIIDALPTRRARLFLPSDGSGGTNPSHMAALIHRPDDCMTIYTSDENVILQLNTLSYD